MTHSQRLTELGITLPQVAAPVAAYVPAVQHAGLVWTSGQLPVRDGTMISTGLVGKDASVEDATAAARQSALNAIAAAAAEVGGIDNLTRVVKVVGFVASDPSFTGQPQVINGASELLAEIFGEAGAHARAAVGVASLPLNVSVEVEVVFATE